MNIFISAFEITVLITAIFTFFGVSIFVLFQYFLYQKKIRNEIDEILLNHAKYIKQEFDKHKEEQIELFDETQKLANKIIEKLNNTERLHTENLKILANTINENTAEIKKLEEQIALRDNEITKLQNKIREKDGIIARKTKQIQRLKDGI